MFESAIKALNASVSFAYGAIRRKFRLNEVFLKRVDRIEALMTVMVLVLFINNLGELKLRKALKKNKKVSQGGQVQQQRARHLNGPLN